MLKVMGTLMSDSTQKKFFSPPHTFLLLDVSLNESVAVWEISQDAVQKNHRTQH